MHLRRVIGVKMESILAVALVLVLVPPFASFPMISAVAEPTYTYDVVRNIYTIHSFGGITVATLNRSALRYLGDGYWLIVLPDMDLVTFSEKIVEEVAKFMQPLPLRIFIDAVPEGFKVGSRGVLDISRLAGGLIEAAEKLMREFNALHAEILLSPSPTIFIESKRPLDAARAVEIVSNAWSGKVAVVEVFGWGMPDYFDAPDLYENLMKIPCFVSAGESPIGVDIWLNITCAEDLAKSSGRDFNATLSEILNSVKALNPVIRKYMPHQDIVIVVAQPPPKSVPLPGELIPITSTTSGSKAEEPQQSNAINTVTSTWISTTTPTNTQNLGTVSVDRNSILMATAFSSVAIALILIIVSKHTLIRHRTLST